METAEHGPRIKGLDRPAKAPFRRGGCESNAISPQSELELFEDVTLPHLDAAHNLAGWLTRNEGYAQHGVQESYLRAFRFFDGYKGDDGKAWLLAILRNTCRKWLRRQNHETEAVAIRPSHGSRPCSVFPHFASS